MTMLNIYIIRLVLSFIVIFIYLYRRYKYINIFIKDLEKLIDIANEEKRMNEYHFYNYDIEKIKSLPKLIKAEQFRNISLYTLLFSFTPLKLEYWLNSSSQRNLIPSKIEDIKFYTMGKDRYCNCVTSIINTKELMLSSSKYDIMSYIKMILFKFIIIENIVTILFLQYLTEEYLMEEYYKIILVFIIIVYTISFFSTELHKIEKRMK